MSTVLPEPLVLDIYDSWFVKYIKKHKKTDQLVSFYLSLSQMNTFVNVNDVSNHS